MGNCNERDVYMFLYFGIGFEPPEYPTFVRKIPYVPPKRESALQKQPIPKVAVSYSIST